VPLGIRKPTASLRRNYERRGDAAKSLTVGDSAAEQVWPVVHEQAQLDPLPYLKTLARDDEVALSTPSPWIEQQR
jgi:hypothetical protein